MSARDLFGGLKLDDPGAIRKRVLDELAEVGEADGAIFYRIADIDGQIRIGGAVAVGTEKIRRGAQLVDRYGQAAPVLDFRRPPPAHLRRFVTFPELAYPGLEESSWYREVWEPGLFGDQLRLLVYQGGFSAYVGAVRERGSPLYERKDRRRAQPLVNEVASLLCAAEALDRQLMPQTAAVLLTSEGRIQGATEGAKRWLDREAVRAMLVDAVCRYDRGESTAPALVGLAEARIARFDGGGDRSAYLVTLAPATPVRVAADARLSPTQRKVAAAAARGASVSEIAALLAVSSETIRSHLREIYRRLGISTRLELVRALQERS